MIDPPKVRQVLEEMGWRFIKEDYGLYLFDHPSDSNVTNPLVLDLSMDKCTEESIRNPLEKNGVDWSIFTQLLDAIDG